LMAAHAAAGRFPETLTLSEQIATIEHRLLSLTSVYYARRERQNVTRLCQENKNLFLTFLLQNPGLPAQALQLGLDRVIRHRILGSEPLALPDWNALEAKYPDRKAQLQRLFHLGRQITCKTLNAPGLEGLQTHQDLLADWNEQKTRLESDLAAQIPEWVQLQNLRDLNAQMLASTTRPGTAWVIFTSFQLLDLPHWLKSQNAPETSNHYLAFVVAAGQPHAIHMIDLGDAQALDPTLAFDKISAVLTNVQQLTVVPAGILEHVAFESLPMAQLAPLANRLNIRYVRTTADWLDSFPLG